MIDTRATEEKISHEEAELLAKFKRKESNLARCYLDNLTELAELREFIQSLNSLAFEEWYGRYVTDDEPLHFVIFDGEGSAVAKGADALEAFRNMGRKK